MGRHGTPQRPPRDKEGDIETQQGHRETPQGQHRDRQGPHRDPIGIHRDIKGTHRDPGGTQRNHMETPQGHTGTQRAPIGKDTHRDPIGRQPGCRFGHGSQAGSAPAGRPGPRTAFLSGQPAPSLAGWLLACPGYPGQPALACHGPPAGPEGSRRAELHGPAGHRLSPGCAALSGPPASGLAQLAARRLRAS